MAVHGVPGIAVVEVLVIKAESVSLASHSLRYSCLVLGIDVFYLVILILIELISLIEVEDQDIGAQPTSNLR